MKWSLAIHGGAGSLKKGSYTKKQEERFHKTLARSLQAGKKILSRGGPSLDAVVAAVKALEDSPLFNAGKGAVLANNGKAELDASIMEGHTRNAGAVCGSRKIRNPILAAQVVLNHTHHILLSGRGAEAFVKKHKVKLVDNDYFHTALRKKQLKMVKKHKVAALDHSTEASMKSGTVGAVARDTQGHLAAGTSTGGMTNKLVGRVSDSSLIGAGNYADDLCAVSTTGEGDYFIRAGVAKEISDRIRFGEESLTLACLSSLEVVRKLGGRGGLIAVNSKGQIVMPFNSDGMFRGRVGSELNLFTAIYGT